MKRFPYAPSMTVLLIIALAGTSWGATLAVGSGETYATIQAAVDAASPGDVITVREGIYPEHVTIATNGLSLVSSDGPGLAVIEVPIAHTGISVGADLGAAIDGFTIVPRGSGRLGIYFDGGSPSSPVSVTNCTLENFGEYGFYASWSYLTGTNFTFMNNTLRNCSTGIYVYGFNGCTILINGNAITDCETGMELEEFDEGMGTDAEISGNTVTMDSATPSSGYGITICCPENTTRVSGNTVRGPFEYGLHITEVGCCGMTPVILSVEGNMLSGATWGLEFEDLISGIPGEVTVRNNLIKDNSCGINVNSFAYASDPLTSVEFSANSITGSLEYGFYNWSGELVNAKGNWWGDASGPFDDKTLPGTPDYNNLAGTGDRVSDYVDYDPWLTEAPKAAAPVLLSPANGAADVSVTVTLETEPFDAELAVTHKSTIWQVSTASGFSSGLVIDEESTSNLTSYAVPDGTLANGTAFFWRVRFRDSEGTLTDWSDSWSFTTETEPGPAPTPSGGGGGGCSAGCAFPPAFLLVIPLCVLLGKKKGA